MVLLQINENAKFECLDFPNGVIVRKGQPTEVNLTAKELKILLSKNSGLMVIMPSNKKESIKKKDIDETKEVPEEAPEEPEADEVKEETKEAPEPEKTFETGKKKRKYKKY